MAGPSSLPAAVLSCICCLLFFLAMVAAIGAWARRRNALKEGVTGDTKEKEDVPIFQLSINNTNTGSSGGSGGSGSSGSSGSSGIDTTGIDTSSSSSSSSSTSSTTTTTTSTAADGSSSSSSDTTEQKKPDPVSKLPAKRASCAGKYVEPNPFGQIETIADRLSYLEDLRFSEGNNTDISTLLLLTLAQQKLNTSSTS